MMRRRQLLQAISAGFAGATWRAAAAADAASALTEGGVVVLMRHALAPGVGDPAGFDLAQCSTQRNLSDEGREQARRIGAWFRSQNLRPSAVRSSQWCRCLETARLAFGDAQAWPALNSTFSERSRQPAQDRLLREALARLPRGRFEVWVTHQVNISALVGDFMGSGEAVVVGDGGADAPPQVLAPLKIG